jgi:energy-coupling factor transporter ATP-binding protein EcfA2
MNATAVSAAPAGTDWAAHLRAFCSPAGAEVFHSIVGPNEVWTADPYDVPEIHAEPRELFDRLLNRATGEPAPEKGRALLLLGESGSGKTHLMRAFRQAAHATGRGYCGYLQMTSTAGNYDRYVLAKVVDSLEQPYREPDDTAPGLLRLSTGLFEATPGLTDGDRERMRDGDLESLHRSVRDMADRLISERRFASCDLDLLRAVLYLPRDDARVKHRVLKYLRAEDLEPQDRAMLGGLVPRREEHEARDMIVKLGRLMNAVHQAALVLLVDQLEEVFNAEEQGVGPFRRAIDSLTNLGEAVPSSVVVIACLEDYFTANREHLPKPRLDRLEVDPVPFRLASNRNAEEVVSLVYQRLLALFDREGLSCAGLPRAFPFAPEQLRPLAGARTRDVLTHCLRHQERCAQLEKWLDPQWDGALRAPGAGPGAVPCAPDTTVLEQLWNDFQATFPATVPDEDGPQAGLVKWAVEQIGRESTTGHHFAAEVAGRLIPIEVHHPDNSVEKVLAAICNKSAKGGHLGKQITDVEKEAGEITTALVRSTAFPANPATAVCKQLGALVKRGGRLVAVEDADWRKVLALQEFQVRHGSRPDYDEWLRRSRPLSQLPALRRLLALDQLATARPAVPPPQPPLPPQAPTPPTPSHADAGGSRPVAAASADSPTGVLRVGDKAGVTEGSVTIPVQELKQHAAFLGATGSGKTTAALNAIEQLLARGIPALLVDRKGDLCRYADPAAWEEPLTDPSARDRRERLRPRLDVALFTPGHPQGRPLTLPVVPPGIDQATSADRDQLAGYAAAALGGMLGYSARSHQPRLAILRKAIEVLSGIAGRKVTVSALHDLVADRDDALLAAVGGQFEERQYRQLGEALLALQLNQRQLLEGGDEQLDVDAFFRGDQGTGRTRLTIISTRFLPDVATVEFWVAQLLAGLNRWAGKSPSNTLQAVVLFDEADRYLPAVRQPATKAPLEDLLRRGRSAGLGVFLASQSPGDFDYKCRDNIRTWLVGQVKEETALRKLKPMFSEARVDAATRLPGQATGYFHLLRGKAVAALRGHPSLIRTEQLPEERILELARGG